MATSGMRTATADRAGEEDSEGSAELTLCYVTTMWDDGDSGGIEDMNITSDGINGPQRNEINKQTRNGAGAGEEEDDGAAESGGGGGG